MGVEKIFGPLVSGVAKGLSLRMDHGSQYKSEDFRNQIRYWGIAPSMGYVREQETNGVVERFNRTFKEPSHFKRSGVLNYLRKGIRPRRQLRFSTYHLEPLSRTLKASNISLAALLRLNFLRSKPMGAHATISERLDHPRTCPSRRVYFSSPPKMR